MNVSRYALLALGIFACATAACGGKGAYAPAMSTQLRDQMQSSVGASTGCPPPYGTYGKIYVILTDAGNVKNGTFTPMLGSAVFERASYSLGSSPPPTIPPHPPIYVYRGTYKDIHGGVVDSVGCAVLVTTQSGQPLIPGGNANANDSEAPTFMHGTSSAHVAQVGAVTALTITKLSATGGHGSYKLSDGSTGTITFTLRQTVP